MMDQVMIISDIVQLQIIIMLLLVLGVMIMKKDQHIYLNEILMDHGIKYKNQSQMMEQIMDQIMMFSDIVYLQIIIMLLLVLMFMIISKDQHIYLNEILMDHGIKYKNQSQMIENIVILSDIVQLQIIVMLLLVLFMMILVE